MSVWAATASRLTRDHDGHFGGGVAQARLRDHNSRVAEAYILRVYTRNSCRSELLEALRRDRVSKAYWIQDREARDR